MKRYLRKRVGKMIEGAVVVAALFAAPASVFAAEKPVTEPQIAAEVNGGLILRAEETEWVYRVEPNLDVWKRLWSLTYGYWKTDWIFLP